MQTVRWRPKICTLRFFLKSFERFQLMEQFENTAMLMYGQILSAISSDTLGTDATFLMMALTFLSILCILDEAGTRKIFTIRENPGRYPRFFGTHQGAAAFLSSNVCSKICTLKMKELLLDILWQSIHSRPWLSYSDISRGAFEACRMNSPPRSLQPRSPPPRTSGNLDH